MPTIDFHYDVVCPYAYLASARVEALAARRGATVRWIPLLLGGVFRSIEAPQVPADQWSMARAQQIAADLFRYADLQQIPLRFPPGHPRRTVDAMRLCCAAPDAARPALSHALYRAYWVDNADLSDPTVLSRIATDFGLAEDAATSEQARTQLRANTERAVERGVFGVPAMFVGEHFFWGQDRLHLLERALGGPQGPDWSVVSERGGTVRVFHDFSSPFSYLGLSVIERVAARHGATVERVPILLGALFNAIGTPNVPLFAMSPAKRRYVVKDLNDQADWWGLPFAMPTVFPVRTVTALRLSILEPRLISPLYQAMWVDGRDIGDAEVLRQILDAEGLPASLLERTQEPAIKAQLRANTEEAAALGVPGVPTFQLDGQLFWGGDRLPLVEAWLGGWRPVMPG